MAEKTIKIADKDTLDSVKSILQNGTYGNSALNADLDTIISYLSNSTYGLNAIKAAASASGGSHVNMQRYVCYATVNETDTNVKQVIGPYGPTYQYTHTFNLTSNIYNFSVTGAGRVLCDMACSVGNMSYSNWTSPLLDYNNEASKSYLPTYVTVNIDGYNIDTTFANLFLQAGKILEFNKNFSITLTGGLRSGTYSSAFSNSSNLGSSSKSYQYFSCYIQM